LPTAASRSAGPNRRNDDLPGGHGALEDVVSGGGGTVGQEVNVELGDRGPWTGAVVPGEGHVLGRDVNDVASLGRGADDVIAVQLHASLPVLDHHVRVHARAGQIV